MTRLMRNWRSVKGKSVGRLGLKSMIRTVTGKIAVVVSESSKPPGMRRRSSQTFAGRRTRKIENEEDCA